SPVLATSTRAALRPALISISPGDSARRYSPGCKLRDGVMYGHQFRPIREGRLDLDFVNHFRDAFHDIFATKDGPAVRHDFCDALSIAGRFQDLGREHRHRLRVVELQATPLALAGQFGCGEDPELFLLAR